MVQDLKIRTKNFLLIVGNCVDIFQILENIMPTLIN